MSNPNDPAYPIHVPADPGWRNSVDVTHCGMTIRQRFVMAAMQATIACGAVTAIDAVARDAVAYADAALAEEARTRGTQ